MDKNQTLTRELFEQRLAALLLRSGLAGMPKDVNDQHILLKSAVLMLGPAGTLTEKEVTERLEGWVKVSGQGKTLDRVSTRRALIDAGYLTRSADGASYEIARPGPRPELFAAAVEDIDVPAVLEAAREEAARRKAEYLARAK